MPLEEERIKKTFEDIEKESEKRKVNPLQFFSSKAFLWIGLCMIGLFWLYSTQKMKFGEALALFAFILIVVYLMGQKTEEAGYLRDEEVKDVLYTKLRHRQIYTNEVPDGIIDIDMRTKEIRKDVGQGMKPESREVGFSVTDRNTGLKEYFVAEVNILKADRPGDIISIADCPGKFDGKMSRDIKVIMSSEIWAEKKYTDLMRKKG